MNGLIARLLLPGKRATYDRHLSGLRQLYGIPVLHIKQPAGRRRGVLVFFHGNNTDLGGICRFAYLLSAATGFDVVAPEYPGYGLRSDEPAAIDACIGSARSTLMAVARMYMDEVLVVAGRSIGTAIGAQAMRGLALENLRLVLLVSPFASLRDLASDRVPVVGASLVPTGLLDTVAALRTLPLDVPVAVVHGVDDALIPVSHAQRLQRNIARAQLFLIPGDHDRLSVPLILGIFRDLLSAGGGPVK